MTAPVSGSASPAPRSGVYHAVAGLRVDLGDAGSDGWRLAHLDGDDSLRGVLELLGKALGLPDWYGVNLDALWDCLRDVGDPVVIAWDGWLALADADPGGFARLVLLLGDRAIDAGRPSGGLGGAGELMVLLRGGGPPLDPTLGVRPFP